MKIKIYQINFDRDLSQIKFRGFKKPAESGQPVIDSSLYDIVFTGDVDCRNLEEVYAMFNERSHPLHRGHSLSVSDVVVTEEGAFFCDVVGWDKVGFDESKAHRPVNLMKIVYVEPHRKPFISEVENRYEALSKAVEGLIENFYNNDGTLIVLNEECKLNGMEGNRHVGNNGTTVIAGPFFVVGDDGAEYRSLTDEEIAKYMERFDEVEEISSREVQQDNWIRFISWNGGMML